MTSNKSDIQEFLLQRAEYQARINLIPYEVSPEVKHQKESKYLYMRKRVAGKLTSTYVAHTLMNYFNCCYVLQEN